MGGWVRQSIFYALPLLMKRFRLRHLVGFCQAPAAGSVLINNMVEPFRAMQMGRASAAGGGGSGQKADPPFHMRRRARVRVGGRTP